MVILAIFPQYIVSALGATLFHSLWQGGVLAALTGITISVTASVDAALRYRLMLGMLLVFCLAVALTFFYQLPSKIPADSTFITVGDANGQPISGLDYTDAGLFQQGWSLVRQYNETLVWLWMAIVTLRAIQLAIGLRGIYRLKLVGLNPVDGRWAVRVAQMTGTLGITRAVRVAESTLARVPMVVGHLKPLVLFPVGLLTALSVAEVEAILAHELAHIHRKDYLVNMLISVIEILFFFNPAVLWLVTLIKYEREHCCDDMAITITLNKAAYVKALVACEEYEQSSSFAMAFTGRGTLLQRVNRLLTGNRAVLNRAEKSLVALGLLGVLCFSAYVSNQQEIRKDALNLTAVASPRKPAKVVLVNPSSQKSTSGSSKVSSPKDAGDHSIYKSPYKAVYDGYHPDPKKVPSVKTGISVKLPREDALPPIRLLSGEDSANSDIAAVLAKAILQDGLTEEITSFRMTALGLVLNNQQLADQEFERFKSKYIEVFDKGTTVYLNFDTKNSLVNYR